MAMTACACLHTVCHLVGFCPGEVSFFPLAGICPNTVYFAVVLKNCNNYLFINL